MQTTNCGLTIGKLKKMLEAFDDDAELCFEGMEFYRLKVRGEKLVQMEFNDKEPSGQP